MPKNCFKSFENLILEGNFKLKRIFFSKNQIQIDQSEDDLSLYYGLDKKQEPIPQKMDFNIEVPFSNQIMSYHRI